MIYDPNNIFAKILRGDIPSKKIYEDDFCLVFNDIHPQAPVHAIAIPKGEYTDFSDFHTNASFEVVVGFYNGIQSVINLLKIEDGYRILTNKGEIGGQTVPHYHVHILSGKPLGAKIAGN